MAEHTGGEWTVVGDYVYARIENDDDNPDDIEIARVTRPADARLIAASPDLFAALEVALDALTHTVRRAGTTYDWNRDRDQMTLKQGNAFNIIDAALAKARGATDD